METIIQGLLREAVGRLANPAEPSIVTLLTTIHLMVGKVNFTNLSRYSALTERSYRRQYDEAFEFMAVNSCLISRAIAPERFQVSAIDCSFVPKSGKATYGVDRFYNGKAGRAEPGLEISTIAVVDVGASMAYALSVQQTPAEPAAETQPDAMTRIDYYLGLAEKV